MKFVQPVVQLPFLVGIQFMLGDEDYFLLMDALIKTHQSRKRGKQFSSVLIGLYMGILERQDEEVDFDPALFALFVDKVIVSGTKRDIQLRFILADGSEWSA